LEQSSRTIPKVVMITSPDHARVYEYDAKNIESMEMDKDYLILTNHTRHVRHHNRCDLNHLDDHQGYIIFCRRIFLKFF
jgi:hypothetical protein